MRRSFGFLPRRVSLPLVPALLFALAAGCGGDGAPPAGEAGSGGSNAGKAGAAGSGSPAAGSSGSGASGRGGSAAAGTSSGAPTSGASPGGTGAGGSSSGAGPSAGKSAGGSAQGGAAAGGMPAAGSGGGDAGGSSSGGSSAGGTAGDAGSGAAGGGSGAGGAPPDPVDWPLINGVQWADTEGNPIQAHGGGIVEADGYYYWFGENRNPDGTFYAVSAYRSRDLVRWEFVRHVLRETSGAGLDPANIERPKVVFNASTGKYVMWMHWENGSDYGEARAAVASSDSVAGDYTYHGSFRPLAGSGVMDHGKPGYMSRDCTLFVDDDGKAYFISAADENYDLNLYLLTPDYLEIEELVATLFPQGHREAPALFKRNEVYFLLTSGATGWDPNQAQYATSRSLASGWSSMTNVGDGNTFHSQSTFVLPVQGSGGTAYLYLGDRWAGAWGGRVNDSTYVWQPITFPSATSMSMSWNNTLTLDPGAGSVSGATNTFRFVNVKSGKALDVEGASSSDGADLIQNPESEADNQGWSLNYDGEGFFRITNVMSGKIIDVPDESTSDGVELAQWEDNGGDHQVWLLVDLGEGRFKIKNKKSGLFVGVVQASTADGAAVEQRTGSDGEEQQWRIVAR
ncbi:MAG TPA: RICIN domain-containing protein [Polyangiaceae bacterium]